MTIDHSSELEALEVERLNGLFIANAPQTCAEQLEVVDPATGRRSGSVGQASLQQVDEAVASAAEAQGRWFAQGPAKRAAVIGALARLVRQHEDELALLESLNTGMPLRVAKDFSVRACYRNLEYFASWADKIGGEVVTLPGGPGRAFDYTVREPYGVVVTLTAWNTPMLFLGSKCGPALIMGNTVVLKPSELASWTALRFAELAKEAGVPDGVLNVITGDGRVGRALTEHPGVGKITFTGGGGTARQVLGAAAGNLTPCSLELGGKSACILAPDADIEAAAAALATACFGLSGQTCVSPTRIFAPAALRERFVEAVATASAAMRLGDPLDEKTRLGPVISERQMQRILGLVEEGRSLGAEVALGGQRMEGDLAAGFFVPPTVLLDAPADAPVARDEVFGPVMNVFAYDDIGEAIARANATEFGLAAGVFTRDLNIAHRAAGALQAGTVWVNTWGVIPNAAPFGGFKRSGIGREGGRAVLEEFSQVKNVYVSLQEI